ncbi:MAG: rhodanese-like domain-containing protein [Dehalococcoidia bacterium]
MPTNVDRAEVQRLVKDGAQLVDVLPEGDFEQDHISGAINIPLTKLDRESTAGLDRHRPVVVYCHDIL